MLRRITALIVLSVALSSCSYAYDVLAIARDGRVAFIVDPASGRKPSCLRRIEVTREGGHGTSWSESVGYDDDCANRFPLPYGVTLKGEHLNDHQIVPAAPLLREVVYEISTTSGATGYGSGRFVIHENGRIENLQRRELAMDRNEVSPQP